MVIPTISPHGEFIFHYYLEKEEEKKKKKKEKKSSFYLRKRHLHYQNTGLCENAVKYAACEREKSYKKNKIGGQIIVPR